jgi:hypothetical protein
VKPHEVRDKFSENKQRSIALLRNAISTLEDEIATAGPVVDAATPTKKAVQDRRATVTAVEVRMTRPRRWGGIASKLRGVAWDDGGEDAIDELTRPTGVDRFYTFREPCNGPTIELAIQCMRWVMHVQHVTASMYRVYSVCSV